MSLEKEWTKPSVSRRKKMTKDSRNKWIETRKTIEKVNKTKSRVFFAEVKLRNLLARLKKTETQINKIRSEKDITAYTQKHKGSWD